jgi:hypothetical protein
MTTQITQESNPRLPKPDRYRAHIDKILPDDARPPLPAWLPYVAAGCALLGLAFLVALVGL